jgi:integrase
MAGCRYLTDDEIQRIEAFFGEGKERYGVRNLALFRLMIYSGYRISEILSLTVEQVMPYPGVFVESITVERCNMNGKRHSRTVPLHPDAQKMIEIWITQGKLKAPDPLFKSQRGEKAISRIQAWRIYHHVKNQLQLIGKVGPHSTRKTFAKKLYAIFEKDILKVQQALGHARTDTTAKYLDILLSDIHDGILKL